MVKRGFITNIDEELSKKQPDFLYNGAIPADTDKLDFISITLQGVRLA